MSEFIIKVENLGKQYSIRHQHDQYGYVTLRDLLARKAKAPLRWLTAQSAKRNGQAELSQSAIRNSQSPVEDFWALKDVSFEIKQGEVVGIIGRNGAGKSTLLKILSLITEPTEGRVRLRGRVASLLEVGTGFHPELTGRENIFLNGAVLGMSRVQILNKFDEIVAFAEIEKFLDTPVKRYSSGMYVRLAFAVAAHLEPEILVIDEVLAVGDVEFQKKCLGRMENIAHQQGRTVLFVSHNLASIQVLCGKVIRLNSGRLVGVGSVEEQIAEYLKDSQTPLKAEGEHGIRLGDGLELRELKFSPSVILSGDPIDFSIELMGHADLRIRELAMLIYSNWGTRVAVLDLRTEGVTGLRFNGSPLVLRGTINTLPLVEGDYTIGLYVYTNSTAQNFLDLAPLQISSRPKGDGHVPYPASARGFIELDFSLKS